MTDLLTATQDAVFDALATAISPNLASVLQHVPEGTEPPLVIVGSIDATNIGGKDGGFEQHVVEVVSVFRGEARRGLFAIMAAVRDALEGELIAAAGAEFERPVWQSSATELDDDGVTYLGIQTFEIIVQPDE